MCKLKGGLKGWLPKSDTSGSGMSISRWGAGNIVLHLPFERAQAGQGKDGEPGLMGTSEGGAGRGCKEQLGHDKVWGTKTTRHGQQGQPRATWQHALGGPHTGAGWGRLRN